MKEFKQALMNQSSLIRNINCIKSNKGIFIVRQKKDRLVYIHAIKTHTGPEITVGRWKISDQITVCLTKCLENLPGEKSSEVLLKIMRSTLTFVNMMVCISWCRVQN